MTADVQLSDAIFRVIDTETTGTEPDDRVIELAWLDIDHTGTTHGRFASLIDPEGVEIKPGASAVHHLVAADLIGAPALETVRGMMEAEVYVAHNAPFDAGMLKLQDRQWICTHRLAKHLLPHLESHSNQFLRYALKLEVPIPQGTASHRSEADVTVTAVLLLYLLPLAAKKWPHITTVAALAAAAKAPVLLERIGFTDDKGKLFSDVDSGLLRWIVKKQAGGEDAIHTAQYWLNQRGR